MTDDAGHRGRGTGDSGQANDGELLRRYAGHRDEAAFAELVRRHLGLVYHAALRQCGGDAHRAEDVAQAVFSDLARKAGKLARRPVLAGWLYTSTRYAAAQAVRTEARRQAREQEAQAMNEAVSPPSAPTETIADWEHLRPVIDDALHALGERDREAVLLRFFEGKDFARMGEILRLSEDGARMRVARALEKMRATLARRGVTSTSAALAVALANQAGMTAPAGLVASVASGALAAAAGDSTIAAWGLSKIYIAFASAVVATVAGVFAYQRAAGNELRREIAELKQRGQEVARLRDENRRLGVLAAEGALLRRDDVELARLRDEAEALKARLAKRSQEITPPRGIAITGQINYPGMVQPTAGTAMTLREAVARAGGPTRTANIRDVRVTRTLANGLVETFRNLDPMGSDKGFVVEPGDAIYVPEDLAKRGTLPGGTPAPKS